MKIKLIRTNDSFSLLRMKIIAGYGLLFAILGIVVFSVWLGHRKMETLNSSERLIKQRRKVMNQTFEKLLDFSFSDDILLLRDNDKLDEYQMKREVATDALNGLKQYYRTDGVQHTRVDRVSSLLLEKEKLLIGVMNTLSGFLRTDSLLQRRIPVIISQTVQQQQPDLTATTENKRGGLFGLFKKTEEKSAYARQREKRKQPSASRRTTGELYSLQKEIHAQYTDSWNKLSAYSDSLQQRDRELNSQINELTCEFEQAAIVQSDNEAKQMTYYYRLEAEKEQPEKEIFHPGRTVEETVHSFLPMAAKKGLGLTVEVADSDVLVEGDRGRLVQILNDLLSNAVKFTRAGYIHAGATYRNGALCFFVRDTGTGIDRERQERLFTAFERGGTHGTEQVFGLGLAITYKLVTLLEGTFRVQSARGSGSTFEVCLPIREADGNPGDVRISPEQDSLSGMRVLAIDDDQM